MTKHILVNEKFESRTPFTSDNYDKVLDYGIMNGISSWKEFESKEKAFSELKKHRCEAYTERGSGGRYYILNSWYAVSETYDENGELLESDWIEMADFKEEE